jgi:tRNA (guanine-N7-)-methyltransferase
MLHDSTHERGVSEPGVRSAGEPVLPLLYAEPRMLPPLHEIFGNQNPVETEIGCGKAKFLIARAAQYPEINFLGIDVVWKWMKYAVERCEKRRLENIKFLRADARETVRHGLQDGAVSIFHIYFPDPWPKRRHRKRRLVTGEFLRTLHAKLTSTGLVELATDHTDYFLQMQRAVIQSGIAWKDVRISSEERLFDAQSKTNYEIKYEAAGRTLHYIELAK